MATLSTSPRLLKGAIIGVDVFNPLASIIIFQYNPDTMTRTLTPQTAGGQGGAVDRSEALRLKGAPQETISLNIEIDATDQLADANPIAGTMGIYPQLASLEMLVYPKSALVIANTILLAAGTIEIIPPAAPLTLFIWGPQRILPVRLTTFTITEEAYDPLLNPLRARVQLGMRVLSYNDLPVTHPGYALFLAHQIVKEVMAVVGSVGSVAGGISGSFSASVSIGG